MFADDTNIYHAIESTATHVNFYKIMLVNQNIGVVNGRCYTTLTNIVSVGNVYF